ncbi:hypothetical protein A6R68_21828 [Neotoma lepida]|uniref:Uncharacterized protein n=1 Tax=Neotoma lepida TaxID=56216 RepID=A0A1A6HQG9_NEOLE|nr:hypothetical protein A6R68_21828 [Neotoma lepida]
MGFQDRTNRGGCIWGSERSSVRIEGNPEYGLVQTKKCTDFEYALLYSAFGVVIEKTRGAEDDLNTVAAGTMTGMLYKCTGAAVKPISRGSPHACALS